MNLFEKQEVYFYKKIIHQLMKLKTIEKASINIYERVSLSLTTHEPESLYRLSIYLHTFDLNQHSLFLAPTHDYLFQKDWSILEGLKQDFNFHLTLMAHQNYNTKKMILIEKKEFNHRENLFLAQIHEKNLKEENQACIIIDKNLTNVKTKISKKESLFSNLIDEKLMAQYEKRKIEKIITQKDTESYTKNKKI